MRDYPQPSSLGFLPGLPGGLMTASEPPFSPREHVNRPNLVRSSEVVIVCSDFKIATAQSFVGDNISQ